jgi:hypothetical protein
MQDLTLRQNPVSIKKNQGFGSGSVSGWIRINLSCWIRIRIQIVDRDPDPHSNCVSGSGSRRAKMTHKNRKKVQNFHVFMYWMFSFEG